MMYPTSSTASAPLSAAAEAYNPLVRPVRPTSWWVTLAAALLPLAALWAVHAQVMTFPMTRLDERLYLTILKMHSAGYYFLHACDVGAFKTYRPCGQVLMRLDNAVFGFSGWGYHLMGLVYASIALVLFWRLASWLSGSIWAASAGGVFLAVAESNSLASSMISESHNNLPSAICFLAAVLFYLSFQRTGRIALWLLTAVLAWLAIGFWEPGVAALPAIVVLAFFGRKSRSFWYAVGLSAAVLGSYAAMRHHALGELVQEYARETRGYWCYDLEDVLMSELDPAKRLGLYAYTVGANVVGTAVPALFTGTGRFWYEIWVYAPSRINSNSDGSWLYRASTLASQLAVLAMVLATLRRSNWRRQLFVSLVIVAMALASFVLYRSRNHLIGMIAYAAMLSVTMGTLLEERHPRHALRFGLLLALLGTTVTLSTRADMLWLKRTRDELQRTNIMAPPPPNQPYVIDPEIQRELLRRYPPRPVGGG